MTAGYQTLPGGYEVARLRVGVSLRSPAGDEVYFQPGDDADSILETIDALDEINQVPEADIIGNPNMTEDESAAYIEAARARVADIALGEYFS